MRGKIPVTEEQFFDSVDTWIWRLTHEGDTYECGFCKARNEVNKRARIRFHGCSDCLAFELCLSVDSPYNKYLYSDTPDEQPILEILEGLYEIGVKLGLYPKMEVE